MIGRKQIEPRGQTQLQDEARITAKDVHLPWAAEWMLLGRPTGRDHFGGVKTVDLRGGFDPPHRTHPRPKKGETVRGQPLLNPCLKGPRAKEGGCSTPLVDLKTAGATGAT